MDILQTIFLGVGLAMDASSVSMTDGMIEKEMKIQKMFFIAFLFGFFQGIMPFIGFVAGSFFSETLLQYIPWIGFFLLLFIGGKMIVESFIKKEEDLKTSFSALFIQAIATSIDALTTGLIYVGKSYSEALVAFLIIALITFALSLLALFLGKKFGNLLKNKATILGGIILIAIGIKILVESFIH